VPNLSVNVTAMMEMQKFYPTDNMRCVEDSSGFDACVFQASMDGSPCVLPFQRLSSMPYNYQKTCQTLAEGLMAFQLYQLAPSVCRSTCTQMNTMFNYFMPQYLRTQYLSLKFQGEVQPEDHIISYYLYLPSMIKVSTTSPGYGFISLISEIAGWYNLFLGGSVLTMWEFLGLRVLCILAKLQLTLLMVFSKVWKFSFFLVFICILIYIFLNCILTLMESPIGTRIFLTNSLNKELCLSICLPQFTSVYNPGTSKFTKFEDIANATNFWNAGNNLSNKISELNVMTSEGDIFNLWNWSQPTNTSNLFNVFNIISSDQAVDFCHTLELSTISSKVSELQIVAVNDISISVHLAGQLITNHAKYGVANYDTVVTKGQDIKLLESRVSILLEETSLQIVNSQNCKNYNVAWTHDDCMLNQALKKLENKRSLLNRLLRPNVSTVLHGIERSFLQSLFTALSSKDVEISCPMSCRSVVVNMRSEIGAVQARPKHNIDWPTSMPPLPPMLMKVNLQFSNLNRVNEVIILKIYHSCGYLLDFCTFLFYCSLKSNNIAKFV
jgi:hypothetical protein